MKKIHRIYSVIIVMLAFTGMAHAKTVSMSVVNQKTIPTATSFKNAYAGNSTKNTKSYAFAFKADELKQYIDLSGSPILQLVLGEDPNVALADRKLNLFAIPIDTNGSHIYMKYGAGACQVMIDDAANSASISTTLEATQALSLIYSADHLTVSDAATKISTYADPGNTTKSSTTYWQANGLELSRYLDTLNSSGITYVQFILGETSGKLDLIIVGYNGTNHMYFPFGGTNCTLDNTRPCPPCVTSATFEACN